MLALDMACLKLSIVQNFTITPIHPLQILIYIHARAGTKVRLLNWMEETDTEYRATLKRYSYANHMPTSRHIKRKPLVLSMCEFQDWFK